jgi:hypothetical protein
MKYTLPPGRYYIGDICYALKNDIYDNIWGGRYDYSDGKFEVKNSVFVVANTKYGDGGYKGSNGFIYDVDAGVIGMVHEKLMKMDHYEGGTMHTFTEDVSFSCDDGLFLIESNDFYLQINTGYDDDDDDDDEISE